jgi:pimeloyl-ACP methyl ester carboxylesterase
MASSPLALYFISGLGADKRVFSKLKLPEQHTIHHVEWIPPSDNESLAAYAKRLSAVIDTSTPFVLIGLSMGGMMSMEIAKLLKPKQVILISSIKGGHELPWYYKMSGTFYLDKFISPSVFKTPTAMGYYLMGTNDEDSRAMLDAIARDADPNFIKWAMGAILGWENRVIPEHIYHIHGSDDHVLPASFTSPDIILQGGGHLMAYTMADKVSELLCNKLAEL